MELSVLSLSEPRGFELPNVLEPLLRGKDHGAPFVSREDERGWRDGWGDSTRPMWNAYGAMAIQMNRLAKTDILTKTDETRAERPVYRADSAAELPPETKRAARPKRASGDKDHKSRRANKTEMKPKAKQRAPTAKQTHAVSKGEEKAHDTALRLGARARGFTLRELAKARGSKQVGPFKRTIDKGVKTGQLREERRGDMVRYFATGQEAPTPKQKATRGVAAKKKSKTPKREAAPVVVEPILAKGTANNTLKAVANILESFAAFLHQQSQS